MVGSDGRTGGLALGSALSPGFRGSSQLPIWPPRSLSSAPLAPRGMAIGVSAGLSWGLCGISPFRPRRAPCTGVGGDFARHFPVGPDQNPVCGDRFLTDFVFPGGFRGFTSGLGPLRRPTPALQLQSQVGPVIGRGPAPISTRGGDQGRLPEGGRCGRPRSALAPRLLGGVWGPTVPGAAPSCPGSWGRLNQRHDGRGCPPPGLAGLDDRIPFVRFTVVAPACGSGVLQLAQEQHTVAVQLGHPSANGTLEDGYGVWERLTSIRVVG